MLQVCVTGVSVGVLVLTGVLKGVCYRCIRCTYRCVLQVYQVCVTGESGVLTGVLTGMCYRCIRCVL